MYLPIPIFIFNVTIQADYEVDNRNDDVDHNNHDATTERSFKSNAEHCSRAEYDTDFWRQSLKRLETTEKLPSEQKTNWYHNETMSGTYLPNEHDGTCGLPVKYGYIVCPKGQDCDAKQGSYPFIVALGT